MALAISPTPAISQNTATLSSASTWQLHRSNARAEQLHQLIENIATLAARKDHRKSAHVIHEFVVDNIKKKDFAYIDAMLRQVEPNQFTSYELTSLLISTRAIGEKLLGRRRIHSEAMRALLAEGTAPEEADRTLRFL